MSELDNDQAAEATQSPEVSEIDAVKARLDLMGVKYHSSAGLETLKKKLTAALEGKPEAPAAEEKSDAAAPVAETLGQKRVRIKAEAKKLVRIRLTCMNPAKREWPGEIFTAGNSFLGSVSRYVPFNAQDDGWHVEHIIYEQLKERKCQVFQTVADAKGNKVRKGRLIPEFAIELLPPLTQLEIDELARRQALANGTAD